MAGQEGQVTEFFPFCWDEKCGVQSKVVGVQPSVHRPAKTAMRVNRGALLALMRFNKPCDGSRRLQPICEVVRRSRSSEREANLARALMTRFNFCLQPTQVLEQTVDLLAVLGFYDEKHRQIHGLHGECERVTAFKFPTLGANHDLLPFTRARIQAWALVDFGLDVHPPTSRPHRQRHWDGRVRRRRNRM